MTSRSKPKTDSLLDAFWERGLILLGDRVRQEYGLKTPIFIDLRHKLYDDLSTLSALGCALHAKIRELVSDSKIPQQIIGIPDTATPLALSAALASRETDFPLQYGQLRKKPAAYPGGESGLSSYMGSRDPNREITLVDDVMASGRSKLWARDRLAEEGLKIARILVVVHRRQGGGRILEAHGCPVHSLYSINEVVDYYEASGRIDAETAKQVREHTKRRRFGD